jgi:hypothetical protein
MSCAMVLNDKQCMTPAPSSTMLPPSSPTPCRTHGFRWKVKNVLGPFIATAKSAQAFRCLVDVTITNNQRSLLRVDAGNRGRRAEHAPEHWHVGNSECRFRASADLI